jgi:hypothetical protein
MSPPITSKKTLQTSRFIRKIDWNPDKEQRGIMKNMYEGPPAMHNTVDLKAVHAAFGLDMSRAILLPPDPNNRACFYNSKTKTSVFVRIAPDGTIIQENDPIHSSNCGKDGKGKETLFKNP